jgi:hypothetical protein
MIGNQMNPTQLTRELSDQRELIEEIFGLLDTKEQVILDLSKSVMTMNSFQNSFQIQLEIMEKEIKELKSGYTEKEKIVVPQKVTENGCNLKENLAHIKKTGSSMASEDDVSSKSDSWLEREKEIEDGDPNVRRASQFPSADQKSRPSFPRKVGNGYVVAVQDLFETSVSAMKAIQPIMETNLF